MTMTKIIMVINKVTEIVFFIISDQNIFYNKIYYDN